VDSSASIRQYIQDEVLFETEERVDESTPLLNGILDSMALLRLVAFLEEEFEIEIGDVDITADNFRTVADISRMVEASRATAGS
jgi:acyl carrier protein